jgi:putative hydrolase of the HAD superfamily
MPTPLSLADFDVIAFDADDTLWHNEELFWEFKRHFKAILARYVDPSADGIDAYIDNKEVSNIGCYGYGFKSYALSMIEALVELSQGRAAADDIARILILLKQQMAADLDFVAGVREVLDHLTGRIDLMLITKGDTQEQRHKIDKSGLAHYFRWIEVVHRKDEGVYRELLAKHGVNPARFLMVGNALRSDILPVVAIGGQAVYIPNNTTWSHELEVPPEYAGLRYNELPVLSALPALLLD